jgi:hypothetical protein
MKRVRAEWRRIAGYLLEVEVRPPRLEESTAMRTKPRHFADYGSGIIRYHPELEDALLTNIRGVLLHEAGHVLDDELESEEVVEICRGEKDAEQRADILAQWLTGWTIWYGPDLVQRAGPGARGVRPRPRSLR